MSTWNLPPGVTTTQIHDAIEGHDQAPPVAPQGEIDALREIVERLAAQLELLVCQVEQMQGMFDDDDKAISSALAGARAAVKAADALSAARVPVDAVAVSAWKLRMVFFDESGEPFASRQPEPAELRAALSQMEPWISAAEMAQAVSGINVPAPAPSSPTAMQITRESLTTWRAAPTFTAWFDTAFPAGSGAYQAVLDALAGADRPKDAHWLMDRAGPDAEAVLEVEQITGRHCFAAGRLVVRGAVDLAGELRAGGDILVDGHIKADGVIDAGGDLVAQGYIEAAGDLRAGGDIKAAGDLRAGGFIEAAGAILADGDIICPTRPERIARGAWRAPEPETEDSPAP